MDFSNRKLILTLILILTYAGLSYASDVLGCGGFIKSHAPIDFSKIEVKLFTKQGTLKDSTFCAPNNGYYFLPLYDKGEYYLRIVPPTGWSFMPKEKLLKIDGVTDLCSQGKDIDFVFQGFGITGQVDNVGGGPGPKGVKIQLNGQNEVRETFTTDEGGFYFTPVYPGTYIVTASHPKWIFKESKHTVQVASENKALPKNSFLVTGYDVSGSVVFDKQPIANIQFILLSDGNHKPIFDKCIKEKHPEITDKNYLCYVVSNDQGKFTFPQLSPGGYRLTPYYKKPNMKYHIEPQTFAFQVQRDSLVLPKVFEVNSFTFSGRVFTSETNGQSIQGATVFVNDKPVTTTQADGSFQLQKVGAGIYNIHFEAPGVQFAKKVIKISPTVELATKFWASNFQVCGTVKSENSHTILFHSLSGNLENTAETIQGSGEFCAFLSPGKYTVQVEGSANLEDIQFFPVKQQIHVINSAIFDVNFSQLRATVTGHVKCLQVAECQKVSVMMKQISLDGTAKDVVYSTSLNNGKFVFTDVVTGMYLVSLGMNKYCWRTTQHQITVNSETTSVPDFVQTGYNIIFFSSHDAVIQYDTINVENSSKPTTKSLKILPGQNIHCVERPGQYEFVIKSCHMYEKSIIKHNTNDESSEIVLTAIKHLTSFELTSSEHINDLTVDVTIAGDVNKLGPIIPLRRDNFYIYKIRLHLSERQQALFTPHAETLWFKPSSITITGASDCADHGSVILGLKGKVIQGQVLPPLAGVKITVEGPPATNVLTTRETDSSGRYKFQTLDDSHVYKVSAEKKSYTFTGPDNNGIFKAHKLAEIIISVVDDVDHSPLQGALISLSGGESYRSNLQTNANGIITFSSLSPSEYFLRPMMKEYNFEPSSKIIAIEEGATVNLRLSGHRVAYSAYGSVRSLSGEPEDKMVVVADGQGDCSELNEEATTEDNGNFRIRGLHPRCKYDIKVKESLDHSQRIERAVPESISIQADNSDVHSIKLIALRQVQHMDVVVEIVASKAEHLKSLRLKLCKEHNQNSPIFNMKLEPSMYKSPSVLIHLPALPIDNKSYFLQLESSLSTALHNYKSDVEYFVANSSFKHVVMRFSIQTRIQDQDIAHTSVLALPFIILCLIGVYNIQQISKFTSDLLSRHNINLTSFLNKAKAPPVERNITNSASEIDQIVQNINAIKRKVRPKKI